MGKWEILIDGKDKLKVDDEIVLTKSMIKIEKTIWKGSISIGTRIGDYIDISIPDMQKYIGKNIKLYIKYGNDNPYVYELVVGRGQNFINYTRDFRGYMYKESLYFTIEFDFINKRVYTHNEYIVSSSGVEYSNKYANRLVLEKITLIE